jgi:hypothetical protein
MVAVYDIHFLPRKSLEQPGYELYTKTNQDGVNTSVIIKL